MSWTIEELNYSRDPRVRARKRWYKSFDENRMKAKVVLYNEDGDEEELEVPIEFEVCPTCEGRGKHVNPSIDASGLTAEDFYEDPSFAEDYFEGNYDVLCYGCEGARVVPVCIDENVNKRLREESEVEAQMEREREAERRMGA